MVLTHMEIKHIVRIAREGPELTVKEITLAVMDATAAFSETELPPRLRPTLPEILITVAAVHVYSVEDVKSKCRRGHLVRIRQQYALIAKLFRHSLISTGKEINRDHVTARHSYINALKFCLEEPEYLDEVETVVNAFPHYRLALKDRLQTYNISVKCT